MRFSWAEWRPINAAPIAHLSDVTKLVLHRTEGSTVDGAWSTLNRRKVPSHGISDLGRGIHVQMVDTSEASHALWHVDQGGVLQWEIVGFSRDTPDESDAWYAQLAQLILRICVPHYIPAVLTSKPWAGPEGYGKRASQRMTFDEFATFEGVLAHQHAPAKTWKFNSRTNAHWDIGALDTARLSTHLPTSEATAVGMIYVDTEGPDMGRTWIVGGREPIEITNSSAKQKHLDDYGAKGLVLEVRHAGDIVAKMYPPHPDPVQITAAPEVVEIPGAPVSIDTSPLDAGDVARIATAVADEIHRRGAA